MAEESGEAGPREDNPSVRTRFQKGQSGNPKGRPRRTPIEAGLGSDLVMLTELERLVKLPDGSKIPAYRYVIRRILKDAFEDDPLARRQILALHNTASSRLRDLRAELLVEASRYKVGWTRELGRLRRRTNYLPPLPIDPDAIFIDFAAGDVLIRSTDPDLPQEVVRDPGPILALMRSTPPPPPQEDDEDTLSVEEKVKQLGEIIARQRAGTSREMPS